MNKPARARKHTRKAATPQLPFPNQHGGRRAGAGRKPNGERALVDHRPRAEVPRRFPVLVTTKLCPHLPRLRRPAEHAVLRSRLGAGKQRFGFRLVHYVILNDHLHLLCEAPDRLAMRRGLQGLLIRIARGLNRLWRRTGKVFVDRYHDRLLTSPREVRNALVYVLGNARKHAAAGRMIAAPPGIDPFSSAPWFDGFRTALAVRWLEGAPRPTVEPCTWLLRIGWRRHGRIGLDETPKGRGDPEHHNLRREPAHGGREPT